MFLLWAIAFDIFPAVKFETHGRNNNDLRLLKEHWITLFNIVSYIMSSSRLQNRFLWTGKKNIRGPRKNLYITLQHSNSFYQATKLYWKWNSGPCNWNPQFIQWSFRNKEGHQIICHQIICHQTPINIISPICIHLNRLEIGKYLAKGFKIFNLSLSVLNGV